MHSAAAANHLSARNGERRALGIDCVLAAAALERPLCLLLAGNWGLPALQQAARGEAGALGWLRAADLFGVRQVGWLQQAEDEAMPKSATLPLEIVSVTKAQYADFVGSFDQVFSYP